jgi:hypothetical protein
VGQRRQHPGGSIANRDEPEGTHRDHGRLDRLLGLMPINAVVEQVDVQAVIERVDINEILTRVDIDALIERIDINKIVEQVDLNRILDRIDVNAIASRIDIEELVARTEIGGIVIQSTTGLFERALDTLRAQFVRLDNLTNRIVNRILRRSPAEMPLAPPRLVGRDAA